ncbi:MAG: FliM/FliN family flagellar motor switch protein [Phycisphaerae bacterium]|nr:FliM/FliN family flagellar motor switch protein [Phycisphaerae bacterium]
MSPSKQDNTGADFERHLVEQMLAAARAGRDDGEPQVEATPYDWSTPHVLTSAQRARLEQLAARAATEASGRLAALVRTELALTVVSISEHYAEELTAAEIDARTCALQADDRTVAALAVGKAQAAAWVTRLLGGEDTSSDAAAELSPLQAALLTDVLGALAGGLSRLALPAGGAVTCGEPACDAWPIEAEAGATWVCVGLAIAESDEAEPVLRLIVPTASAVAALEPADAEPVGPPEQQRDDALAHLKQVRVPVTAPLAVLAPMRDVMALSPGDVVVTEHEVDGVVGIRVGGRTVFAGKYGQSEGYYALKIVSAEGQEASGSAG